MILVCILEQGGGSRAEQSQYAAIQARYSIFPAYWYFGARVFSGALSADYAERCINLYSNGPYAAECRGILAAFFGLSPLSGKVMLSRNEIERIISDSLRNGSPELLTPLMPLIALNDNPYTTFASGALRELASDSKYKAWFKNQAAGAEKSFGANSFLASRLNYISRG
jgi:DNA-binding phage protein